MTATNLPEVLEWKYGCVANCEWNEVTGWKISQWRHPTLLQPDAAQLALDAAEYSSGGLKIKAKAKIDEAAGAARARRVSPGDLVEQEYQRAYEEATAYKSAGYVGAIPAAVQSWAAAKRWTAQQAADDIIATRNGWMSVLDSIRSARLSGKANVDAATTETGVISARDAAVNVLIAL